MPLPTAQAITDLGNPDAPGGAPTIDEARLLSTLEGLRANLAKLVATFAATSTTAALGAAANAINTTGKTLNKTVLNTTDGNLYEAGGTAATAPWNPVGPGGTPIVPA